MLIEGTKMGTEMGTKMGAKMGTKRGPQNDPPPGSLLDPKVALEGGWRRPLLHGGGVKTLLCKAETAWSRLGC